MLLKVTQRNCGGDRVTLLRATAARPVPSGPRGGPGHTVLAMETAAAPAATAGPPPLLAAALSAAAKDYASDVHLRPGRRVWIRRAGQLDDEWGDGPASKSDVDAAKAWIGTNGTVRTVEAVGYRWRALSFRSGVVLRRIAAEPPPFEMLGLPDIVRDFGRFPDGLVVVAGETGSGKSSTIASLLAEMAAKRRCHILTIEDPQEFTIPDGRSLVTQQEVPIEEHEQALEEVLRADVDVVLFGECRYGPHFGLCLHLAAAGHLVFTTIHAGDALTVCERVIAETGPSGHAMLSATLRAVLTQRLLPARNDPRKRYCATEIVVVEGGIKNIIRPGGNLAMLRPRINDTQYSLGRSLAALVRSELVSEEDALAEASDAEDFKKLLRLA